MMQPNDIVLFQGDSITDCGRARDIPQPNDLAALGRGYPMMIASQMLARYPEQNLQFYNRGISGNRVVDMAARWREDCLNLKPTVVSILIGVNDTWHELTRQAGVPVNKYHRVYEQLIEETRQTLPDVRLVLCEPFVLCCGEVTEGWYDEMDQRRRTVKQLAEAFDAVFVPFQTAFNKAAQAAKPSYWAHDGVHPTVAGHALMTEAWLAAVTQSQATPV